MPARTRRGSDFDTGCDDVEIDVDRHLDRTRAVRLHFPTDVIAGGIAGAGVGIVVPHLHRSEDIKQRRVWVGFAPRERGQGGSATLSGLF